MLGLQFISRLDDRAHRLPDRVVEKIVDRAVESIELRLEARFSLPVETMFGDDDDDDGLPDIIVWCLDGDGNGVASIGPRGRIDPPQTITWTLGEGLRFDYAADAQARYAGARDEIAAILEDFPARSAAALEGLFGVPIEGSFGDDDGLPDVIVWCLDGDGEGGAPDMIEWTFGVSLLEIDGREATQARPETLRIVDEQLRFMADRVETQLEATFGLPVDTGFADDDDDDDGLPDTIIWCLDGNGTGSAQAARRAPDRVVWEVGDSLAFVKDETEIAYDFY